MLNKVILTRDIIFNKEEIFPGSLEELKDNFLRVKRDKITSLLNKIKEKDL